jgi:IMP dehydrogenase
MQPVASLDLIKAVVGPDERVRNLLHLCAPNGPRQTAVIEYGQILGILHCQCLPNMPLERTVREVMVPIEHKIASDTHVRRVAQEFLERDLDAAAVFDGATFLGLVNVHLLLREVGRSWDPLTGLSWSDRLREWSVARLRDGEEITLLFFDIDKFGHYNKQFGHIVGDYVLQLVASSLRSVMDPLTDVLVRYAGDEFVIGTTRPREEAEQLVAVVKTHLEGLVLAEKQEKITFTAGIFGGRRTHERDQTHYAATVDNLINLASKDCMSRKGDSGSLSSTSGVRS